MQSAYFCLHLFPLFKKEKKIPVESESFLIDVGSVTDGFSSCKTRKAIYSHLTLLFKTSYVLLKSVLIE
ncbi:MAG TPA: hypothetical protein DIS66_01200 [Candidatus Omnitrophica bacterium]|nr:hypothetical protein [Candidatus Omnitrophota bacterium]